MINLSDKEQSELEKLEESLWRPETRFDGAYMERVLAPDFFEFGRSGRIHRREDTLDNDARVKEIPITLPLPNFVIHPIDEHTVLTTYISEVAYEEGTETANRSSIWTKAEGEWRIRFHQGTPTVKS